MILSSRTGGREVEVDREMEVYLFLYVGDSLVQDGRQRGRGRERGRGR